MSISLAQRAKIIRACEKGLRIDAIAVRYAVSASTVDRVIQQARASGEVVPIKRGRPSKTLDESFVDATYEHLSRLPFPYPEHLSRQRVDVEIDRLKHTDLEIIDNAIHPWRRDGIRVCTPFFPNRYEARQRGIPARDGWTNEALLKRAIRFQLRYGDPVTPHRVLRALTLLCRTPTVFRPSVARFIYERYCLGERRAWDPCAGYGGRLLGAHTAGVRYLGTDVDQATVDGNRSLAHAIGATGEVTLARAEAFTPPEVDLVFTSPPYFDAEKYSEDDNQSWKQHGRSFASWIDGFLRPVIERAYNALRAGGFLVLNVANVKNAPLVEETISVARSAHFLHVTTLQMPLAAVNRKSPTEPILVFQK